MKYFISIIIACVLFGCGSHGESDGSGAKSSKLAANAGSDVTVKLGDSALLDGSLSSPSIEIQRFFWLKTAGPTIVFEQDAPTQFITPLEIGTYSFKLFVFSSDGRSDTDEITFNVVGQKPLANAGADQKVVLNSNVSLDGSASIKRSEGTLRYLWTPVSFPGIAAPTLSQTLQKPNFLADTIGEYVFSLVVSTDEFTSDPDFVKISVTDILPVANAGIDKTYFVNSTVQLSGVLSTYPSDSVPLFIWDQISGPVNVSLNNSGSLTPSFFGERVGTYEFGLTLRVDGATSNKDKVIIKIVDQISDSLPIADPGEDVTGFVGELINLDGSASTSPTGGDLVYTWALLSGNTDDINISNLNGEKISLIASNSGIFNIGLTVFDGTATSISESVLVTVFRKEDTNLPPQFFEPISEISAKIGEPIMLDISAIDYEDDPINYITTTQVPQGEDYRLEAALDPVIIFRPNLLTNAAKTFTFTHSAQDGISQNIRRTKVNVLPHTLGRNDSRTAIIGRVTDLQGSALQNVMVNCGISFARTDKNGRFSIVRVPDGENVPIIFDGRNAFTQSEAGDNSRNFIYDLETFTYKVEPFVNNNLPNDVVIYRVFKSDLMPISRKKTSNVTNSVDEGMESFKLAVPAASPMGLTGAFTSTMTAHSLNLGLLAAPWKFQFTPSLLVKVRPFHVTYRIPAKITFPNKDVLPTGTFTTIWKANTATNELIPLGDAVANGAVLETPKDGLKQNGYIFTALSVSGKIMTGKDKRVITDANLDSLILLKKQMIEKRKEMATIIAKEKMSKALGAFASLAVFELAYTNGLYTNTSLGNSAYSRLKKEYTKGSDLSLVIKGAAEIATELKSMLGPIDVELTNYLKTIKRDALLTDQINALKDLFFSEGFNIDNDNEVLLMNDILDKRLAQIDEITKTMDDLSFTHDTLTEITAAKLSVPVFRSAKLYKDHHPYYSFLEQMDNFIKEIDKIIQSHMITNDKQIMTVLEVLSETNAVTEVISVKTIGSSSYIGNLNNRPDLIGKKVRVSSFGKISNRIGSSRTINFGLESATDLDVFIKNPAQIVVYENPEEQLAEFPAFVEIQDKSGVVVFPKLYANTFYRLSPAQYKTVLVSASNTTSSFPFAIDVDKPHYIRFGKVKMNTISNMVYSTETLELFNSERNLTFKDIKPGDQLILPTGTYKVKSKTAPADNYWSGTIALNSGDVKSPFGTMEYDNFSVDDTYDITYQIISANNSIAYSNVKLRDKVLLLPGDYKVKANQNNTSLTSGTSTFKILPDELVNPFGILIFDVFTSIDFTYADKKLELLRNDSLVYTDLEPGKDLLLLPGKFQMRVKGVPNKMTYEILIEEGQGKVIMGLVKFSEKNKLYNIYEKGVLVYENVGNESAVLLVPNLYTLDAVEDDGKAPQEFNVVFNSVFTYPDDTILKK